MYKQQKSFLDIEQLKLCQNIVYLTEQSVILITLDYYITPGNGTL